MVFIINLQRVDNCEKEYFLSVYKSAIKELSPLELLIMIYFYRYRSHLANLILISINHLVSSCGYVPNNRKSRQGHAEGISIKFINTLKRFVNDNLINIDDGINIDDLKPSDLFYVQLNVERINFFASGLFDSNDEKDKKEYPFVLLEFSTMDKMIKSGVSDVAGLIYFYLYIKQYISIDDGKEYKHYALVTNDNLRENVIVSNDKLYDSFVSALEKLQLLYKHNFGYREVDGILTQVPNAYVLDTKHFKQAYKAIKEKYKMKKTIPYDGGFIPSVDSSIDSLSNGSAESNSEQNEVKLISAKVDMNPFHDEYNPPNHSEDEMPFDTSGMNPVIKPFNGAFDKLIKDKAISEMNDTEFFNHVGWMGDQDDEDIWDDLIDVESINTDSDEGYEIPIGYKIICGMYVKPMVDGSFKDKSGGYWCLDDGELVPFS